MNSQGIDARLFETINGFAGNWAVADGVMIFFAKYSPIIIAIVLLLLWIRWRRDTQRTSGLAATAALVALGIGQIIGKMFPRARPSDVITAHLLIPRSLDTSFPSDHATLAFAVAAVALAWNRKWGSALIFFALLTAFSRVWVGAHYPGDVIGGAALGTIVGTVILSFARSVTGERLVNGVLDTLHRVRLAAGRHSV